MAGESHPRVQKLVDGSPSQDARYVLYWMQHSQRARDNPALEHAAGWANACNLPLLVLFVVDPDYPEANARHFTFLLDGMVETMQAITERGAHFALRRGQPPRIAAQMARDAAVVVVDRGYLRHLKDWRAELAEAASCLVEIVEGDAIVPVEAASSKKESAARTLRPRIHRALDQYVAPPATTALKVKAKGLGSDHDLAINNVPQFVDELGCDAAVAPVEGMKGGTKAAYARLSSFVDDHLAQYGDGRADIVNRNVSHLSPYLHLGQISPLAVYRTVVDAGSGDSVKSFVEELLVRRELAINFVHYTADYESWSAIPEWARETLARHKSDAREAVYTAAELENGKTDDPYWNAAMREMRVTGYLHNHLRMYWGKRVLGWTNTPQHAHRTLLTLNNKYFLDGRDANSYTNVAWIFGVHDRDGPSALSTARCGP